MDHGPYGGQVHTHAENTSQGTDAVLAPLHKRTYQACIPCRRRKVRCDLGPVDDPHDPPCVRCRRESKECYFSATRRKRKAEGEESEAGDDTVLQDEYAQRNGRKIVKSSGSATRSQPMLQDPRRSMTAGSRPHNSPINGYHLSGDGLYQEPSIYTPSTMAKSEDGQDQQVANETAAALFQSPINIPGDALHLLLKASGESEDLQRRDSAGKASLGQTHARVATMQAPYEATMSSDLNAPRRQSYAHNIDPAISGDRSEYGRSPVSQDTLNVWSRLRFVRAGWFTAREGMLYIKYFYDYICPLTPVALPKVLSYADHPGLLRDEPMLTITMLTIASRYMEIPGPGGKTRAFMIHDRLWTYLQDMITRMFWGQEQFGGGFNGAGTRRLGQANAPKGGLRTLGTIESLLLLSEFHPRSMHFPPRDGDDEILAPENDENGDPGGDIPITGGEPTIATWSEPALRSDRMCWSLIGLSYVLAFELGIFGTYYQEVQSLDGKISGEAVTPEYRRRADRIERVLYTFIIQASGRFGLPSMYADLSRFSLDNLHNGSLPGQSSLPAESVDKTQLLWVELMTIMKACNDELFTTKDQTAIIVDNSSYVQSLQKLTPYLHSWYQRFEKLDIIQVARCIISIEYHYINLYIHSLALQAVMEQWTSSKVNDVPQNGGPLSPSTSSHSAYANFYTRNEPYIKEVIESSRIVLREVVEGLLPNDQLKHAPVRTYFRIVSAAMFLLKTFALGGKQEDVAISLRLLDNTVFALRKSVVDDVHLCLRIADLIEGLLSSIRNQFVRLPPRPMSTPEQARRNAHFQNLDNRDFQYRSNMGDTFQDPLAGISRTYNNPHDSNINIMPPIGNTYGTTTSYNATSPATAFSSNQPLQQQQYSLPQQVDANNPYNMPTEEDWLTLNLDPLLDTNGLGAVDNTWLGPGAFGPETHNNLEVLGKLFNEGYRGDGYGEGPGGMGF